jgi:hypothetical protein
MKLARLMLVLLIGTTCGLIALAFSALVRSR